MKNISSQSELSNQLAAARSRLVVVDFFATWCGPCKTLAPILEELEKKHRSTIFLKVDVDAAQDCASQYDVTAMPTVIFFKSNSEIERVVGADVNEIQTLIKEHESSDAFSGIGQTLEGSSAPIVSPVSGIPKFIEGPGGSCQIQIRLLDGSAIRGEFEPSHTLHRVHDFVKANMDARGTNISEFSLMTNFPKVIYDGAMLDQTLQDAKLTPRAQLIVKT